MGLPVILSRQGGGGSFGGRPRREAFLSTRTFELVYYLILLLIFHFGHFLCFEQRMT